MATELDRGARFMRVYLEHQRRIYGLIRALVPSGPDADDILQETSAVLWQKFDEFDPATNFAAWSLRIARYQVMAYYTARRRQKARLSDETLDAVVERMSFPAKREDERSAALDGCLGGLPEPERQLIELRYRGGATVEEIARHSGKTVVAAYKALARAHDRLLKCMRGKLAPGSAT
jgi:RNA polymerase sigma-70 factor (ECF subfamily)